MMLREHLEASGGWLFRRRSHLPLFVLAGVIASIASRSSSHANAVPSLKWDLGCLAIGLVGLAIRCLTVGFVPNGTSGRETSCLSAESLNTSGMYSVLRNPLYLGNYFLWIGPTLMARSASIAIIVSLVFWLYHERITFFEEEFLLRRFGSAFEEWARVTPAFFPRWDAWRAPEIPCSLLTMLRREYSALFGLVATLVTLDLARSMLLTGRLSVRPVWGWLFVASALVYMGLLMLKRKTRLLHVSGR